MVLQDAIRNHARTDIGYRIVHPSGEVRWLNEMIEALPGTGEAGSARRIGSIHDVTEARQAEEAMRQACDGAERASSARTEFLATISHELGIPLNAIIGFSDVILEGMFGRSTIRTTTNTSATSTRAAVTCSN